MIGPDTSNASAYQPRADMTTETYLRDVADKARARFAAADFAMRRLEANLVAVRDSFDQRVASKP